MSDPFDLGVLYTDHTALAAGTAFPSLWSYESSARSRGALDPPQFWLHRSDPLLNTILPGTQVSVVVNFGDSWVTGRSLSATARVPRLSVFGPFTRPQFLRVGRHVRALGVVLPSILTRDVFGVPAPDLVNQIIALEDVWPREEVDQLQRTFADRSLPHGLVVLRDELLRRLPPAAHVPTLESAAVRLLTARRGTLSIDDMATHFSVSRQRLARRFHEATGVSPKQFGRIVRFQRLVHALLSTDVSQWSGVAVDAGFYDQPHMINEFRGFIGAPPTTFFQPHDDTIDPSRVQVSGRPGGWLR